MNRFTVGGGLYSPLEVEIDGKVFKVRKMGRAVLVEFDRLYAEYEAKAKDLDDSRKGYAMFELIYQQLLLTLGPDAQEAIEGLDFHEAGEIIKFITGQGKKDAGPDPEKNAPKPGDVTAP